MRNSFNPNNNHCNLNNHNSLTDKNKSINLSQFQLES
jgi:hypothetical protein